MRSQRMAGAVLLSALAMACGGGGATRDTAPTTNAVSPPEAPAAADTVPTSLDERPTILFLGTSLTAGLGLDPDSAYPQQIQRKIDASGLSYQVVNGGVSGETSAGLLRRLDWVLRRPADVVVVETGANDGLRGLSVDATRATIAAVLTRIRQARPTTKILLAQMEAPPNLGQEYTSAFRAMFPALASEHGATLLPFLLQGVAGETRLNQSDGIHPNNAGERIVAETVWRSLRPLLTR